MNVYEKDDIPEHFHFKNHNTGDFLMVADEGWFIFKDYKSLKAFTLKGMHGYDPQLESMHSIFYAYGPSFKDGMRIRSFENIHIYPLLCYLLNLEPYAGADGQLEVLQNIIK